MVRRLLKKIIYASGFEVRRRPAQKRNVKCTPDSMQVGIRRLSGLGINPGCIIDVGAAKGDWTNLARKVWPDANFVLIEPLREQIKQIPDGLKANKKISIIEAVAGEEEGSAHLTITNDLDGSGIYEEGTGHHREVKKVPLDAIIDISQSPFLLKLDTHGYEIPIFKGAKKTLEHSVAIIVEVYGFQVSPTGVLFYELCGHLNELGFRLYDIVDIMRRPKDKAFWQVDAFFLRKDHYVFKDNTYR